MFFRRSANFSRRGAQIQADVEEITFIARKYYITLVTNDIMRGDRKIVFRKPRFAN